MLAVPADRFRDELRAVVAANVPGHSTREKQLRQYVQNSVRGDAAIDLQGQALACVLVRDRKPLQRPSRSRTVVDEVPAPNMVLVFRPKTHAAVAAVTQTPLFPCLFRHFKPFAKPDAVDPLEVHLPSFLPKLRRYEAITVTRIFQYQLVDPFDQLSFFRRLFLGLVPLAAPRLSKYLACPTL